MNKINISKKELEDLYINQKLSSLKIAKLYNCSKPTILAKLKKFGIARRNLSNAQKFNTHLSVNHNYFSTPTIQNSYWAGFIGADGNITKWKEFSYRIRIELKSIDKNHLENLKNDIEFNGEIKDYSREKYNTILNSSIIAVTSDKIANDLKNNFNIIQKKSLILQPPNLNNINFIYSYIIGLIDGDGSIYFYGKYKSYALKIVGTKEIVEWINQIFDNLGKVNKISDKNTYEVKFHCNKAYIVTKKLYDFIKINNIKILDRKWNKVLEYEKIKL